MHTPHPFLLARRSPLIKLNLGGCKLPPSHEIYELRIERHKTSTFLLEI